MGVFDVGGDYVYLFVDVDVIKYVWGGCGVGEE